jgi:hypothetical protein
MFFGIYNIQCKFKRIGLAVGTSAQNSKPLCQ